MEIQTYFGKVFFKSLEELLWSYRDELIYSVIDMTDRGSFICLLLCIGELTETELSYIHDKCIQMSHFSVNPCTVKMSRDYVEFCVKSRKIKQRFKTIKMLMMFAKYKYNF